MGDKSIPDYVKVMSRIQLVTGCRTQQEPAEFLGIRQSSISDAKKRGSIPSDWLLTLWKKTGADPDWILTGQETRFPLSTNSQEGVESSTVYAKEIRPPAECSIEELMVEIIRRVKVNAFFLHR